MRISVIISTYESPAYLEKVLWGYAAQVDRPEEIVIADDGSSDPTAVLIERMRRDDALPLRHVWHEDRGFRKTAILNRAIAEAAGDYLVFTDGDCIPRADFIRAHRYYAAPGRFLSGGAFRLPRRLSKALTREDVSDGALFDATWLRRRGVSSPLFGKLTPWPRLGAFLSLLPLSRPSFNGNNSSAWRRDVERVNGFDERMQYGGLDRELGERLVNAGIRPRSVRYLAACVHLDHDRGYKNAETLAANRAIRANTRRQGLTWTEHGLARTTGPLGE